MKRKEAIEKIKALGPNDAICVNNEKDARRICDLMHEAGLKRNTGRNIKECPNRFNGISMICYGMDGSDGHIYYRTSYDNMDCFNKIHKASDFLGGEEEENIETIHDLGFNPPLKIKLNKVKPGINLHSAVNQMGKIVDQEIHFVCGSVRTIENIDTSKIEQSMFTTLITDKLPRDINTENVTYVRIKSEGVNTRPGTVQPLIFHLSNDHKATIRDIIPSTKKLGELIKYRCSNGDMILIKKSNLNAIEG